jgi:protein-S-isoprenylcysteine O-methyltransferase Ste14
MDVESGHDSGCEHEPPIGDRDAASVPVGGQRGLAPRARQKLRKDLFISHVLTMVQGVGFFISLISIYYTHFAVAALDLQRIVGMCIFVSSYGLWFCARMQLGNAFAVAAVASKAVGLKRDGLYRYFSHPIYLFSLLALSGYVLLIDQILLGCVVLVVLLPVQAWRIRREQEVLLATFGEEYRRHLKRVWV